MWGRRNGERNSRLEAALRRHRAEARADFVEGVERRLAEDRPRTTRAYSRPAFAAAISVLILGTFASFGGLSYAASGAAQTYGSVHKAVVKHKLVVSVHTSSAAGQYPHSVLKPPVSAVKPVTHATRGHHAAVAPQAVSAETLPFTGVSLLGTFVVSLGLIGAGIFLRRRERRR
jgi:hypothetical protein